jgi:hypothetical protein
MRGNLCKFSDGIRIKSGEQLNLYRYRYKFSGLVDLFEVVARFVCREFLTRAFYRNYSRLKIYTDIGIDFVDGWTFAESGYQVFGNF